MYTGTLVTFHHGALITSSNIPHMFLLKAFNFVTLALPFYQVAVVSTAMMEVA